MLKNGLTLVSGLVRGRLGKPGSLSQFLDSHAERLQVDALDARPGGIAADGVPRWHEWGLPSRSDGVLFDAGELLGWKTHRNFGYRSYRIVRPELAAFGSCLRIPDWLCDIQDIDGLHATKPGLARFGSLDALARQATPMAVGEAARARLAGLLRRPELQALCRPRCSGQFVRFLWDGRVFLGNNVTPRHFAAARAMARHTGQPVALGGELCVLSMEPWAVDTLRRDFEMVAVSCRDAIASVGFHEVVRKSRTPYLSRRLPRPHANAEVIFLPRTDRRSMAVAATMRAAGFPDVGKHLSTLVLRQHVNAARHGGGRQAQAA